MEGNGRSCRGGEAEFIDNHEEAGDERLDVSFGK